MASNSELEELKKLLAESDEIEKDSDQKRFFKAVGAEASASGVVGADIIYYKYLMWKEELGETNVVDWSIFYRKDCGFPKWIKKVVYSGQTIYKLDPKPFPVNSDIRLKMRKIWREAKQFKNKKKQNLKKRLAAAKTRTTDSRSSTSRKRSKSTTT